MRTFKKTICTILAVAMLVMTSAVMLTGCGSSDHKFDKSDATVNGVTVGMTVDEVKAELGSPNSENTKDSEYLPDSTTLEYDGLELIFYPQDIMNLDSEPVLTSITISSEDIKLNNGLHVGSSKSSVMSSFVNEDSKKPVYMPIISYFPKSIAYADQKIKKIILWHME